MRWIPVVAVAVLCASALDAQTTDARDTAAARKQIEELRVQVEAGALPRMRLEQAEASLKDAEDAGYLHQTLYGNNLTEEQTGEMLAVAQRRVDRRKTVVDQAKQLVEAGGAARLSLTDPLADLDLARREYDLAVTRARVVHELADMARAEAQAQEQAESQAAEERTDLPASEKFPGEHSFSQRELKRVVLAFEGHFIRALPISAHGETAFHRAMGFDHRDRVDVALHPDTIEGRWLREYLEARQIPYFAFRNYVPGKATAAHIHIGPPSLRIPRSTD